MARTIETYDATHDRTRTYNLSDNKDIARYIARERYAWPGGYELFGIADDGEVLCQECVRANFIQILTACKGDGWFLVAMDSVASLDCGTLEEHEKWGTSVDYCAHCNRALNLEA